MQDDLLYGSDNPDRTVRASLQVSPSLFDLMMVCRSDSLYLDGFLPKQLEHILVLYIAG
jgi:hypothetical protein